MGRKCIQGPLKKCPAKGIKCYRAKKLLVQRRPYPVTPITVVVMTYYLYVLYICIVFNLQLHFVSMDTKYSTLSESLGYSDGLAVLGVFLKVNMFASS